MHRVVYPSFHFDATPTDRAAADVWDNNPGGNWENNFNWADNTAPGTGDTATFNLAATYPVTFGVAPTAIQSLTVSAGTVTFQSSGGAKTLNVNSGGAQDVLISGASTLLTLGASLNPLNLTAGDDLSVQSGATLEALFGSDVVANDLTTNGVNGTLRVNGSGSSLTINTVTQQLIAGLLTGSLQFQNSSTGNSFAGGLRVADGTTGVTGSVSITGGSTLTIGGNLSLATQNIASQNGSLTINGTGSNLTQNGRVDDYGRSDHKRYGRNQHRHHCHRRHAHDRHRAVHGQPHRHRFDRRGRGDRHDQRQRRRPDQWRHSATHHQR